ncbi:MAG: alpha-L-rhamnosidase N-terminal domain-containing protein, partial [Clostridiales bacterium]|nr:alpha-L-rhamnosidase N-terminal domain-containing protein [Clostridiales bacterium]
MMKKRFLSLFATGLLLLPLALSGCGPKEPPKPVRAPETPAEYALKVDRMFTADRENPLGIDIETPAFSWRLSSNAQNDRQTAYRVLAAATEEELNKENGAYLWDSQKVSKEEPFGVMYAGAPLQSRQKVFWKVMVWGADDKPSPWSGVATFETGLFAASDWDAKWIGRFDISTSVMTNAFAPVTARYAQMKVTSVGPNPAVEGSNRLQIMEWEIYNSANPSVNLAANKKVSSTDEHNTSGSGGWASVNLTNGALGDGYSSAPLSGRDIAANPVYVTIDLGAETTFDTFTLYGRTDELAADQRTCPNYPAKYDVLTSNTGDNFSTHAAAVAVTAPYVNKVAVSGLPLFAKDFSVPSGIQKARLYIAGLGLYEASVNGKNVADTVFDPGETLYSKAVQYVAYDVTDYLKTGGNTVGVTLGNGVYNIGNPPEKYHKYGMERTGELKFIAQLEITDKNGGVAKVVSDGTWKHASGPIVSSDWYGGEDYDARRELDGWDKGGYDRSDWYAAGVTGAPGALRARNTTPLRVTGEIRPKEVRELPDGS